jgi:hypothetical protein
MMKRRGNIWLVFAGLLSVFAILGFITCADEEAAKEELSTPDPAFAALSVSKTSAPQKTVNFTLSTAPSAGTVFKIYADNSTIEEHPNVGAVWTSGTVFTIRARQADVPAGDYYVTAKEPDKTESGRICLTVRPYSGSGNGGDPVPTPVPGFAALSVSKTSAAQAAVNFTLTAAPASGTTFKVYANNTITTVHTTVKAAWTSGTAFSLSAISPAADVPAADYYVSATAPEKTESPRVALTVRPYTPPGSWDFNNLPVWHGFNLENLINYPANTPDSMDHGKDFAESDFALMKQMGFNFIRMPVHYRHIYTVSTGAFNEAKLAWIDNAVKYGEKYGVHVNICLHSAPGYSVNGSDGMDILTDGKPHFINIWNHLANRYKDKSNFIVSFNLVNEPGPGMTFDNATANLSAAYKSLLYDTITAIRGYRADRLVVIDTDFRKPIILSQIGLPSTDNILQSPHCYAPHSVTHNGMNNVGGSGYNTLFPLPWNFTDPQITWPITNYFNGMLYSSWKSGEIFGETQVKAVFNNNSGFSAGTVKLRVVDQQNTTETLTLVCDGVNKGTFNSLKSANLTEITFAAGLVPAGTKKVEIYISTGDWMKVDWYDISGTRVNCTNLDWAFPPSEMTVGTNTTTNAQTIKNWLFPSPKWDGVPVMIGEMGCLAEYNNAPAAVYRARMMKDYVDAFADCPWAFWEFKCGAMSMFSIWNSVVYTEKIDVKYTPDGEPQQTATYYCDKLWYDAVKHRLTISN